MQLYFLILLGVIQGLTEFIPVSSSGHLSILVNLQEGAVSQEGLSIIVLLHFCSLLAIVIILFNDIVGLFKRFRLLLMYVIATIPGAVVGFFLKDAVDKFASNFIFLGIGFIFVAVFLFLSEKFAREKKEATDCSALEFLFIGLMQAIGILPGVSRSGVTISAALIIGMNRVSAFKVSFILALPLIIGSTLLEIDTIFKSAVSISPINILVTCFVALFMSIIGLIVVRKAILIKRLKYFSMYCFIVGIFCIFWGIK